MPKSFGRSAEKGATHAVPFIALSGNGLTRPATGGKEGERV